MGTINRHRIFGASIKMDKREDTYKLEDLVENCNGRFSRAILRGHYSNQKYCKLLTYDPESKCPYAKNIIVADISCGNHEKLREVYRCDKCPE